MLFIDMAAQTPQTRWHDRLRVIGWVLLAVVGVLLALKFFA